jgi:hypothetical protein
MSDSLVARRVGSPPPPGVVESSKSDGFGGRASVGDHPLLGLRERAARLGASASQGEPSARRVDAQVKSSFMEHGHRHQLVRAPELRLVVLGGVLGRVLTGGALVQIAFPSRRVVGRRGDRVELREQAA